MQPVPKQVSRPYGGRNGLSVRDGQRPTGADALTVRRVVFVEAGVTGRGAA